MLFSELFLKKKKQKKKKKKEKEKMEKKRKKRKRKWEELLQGALFSVGSGAGWGGGGSAWLVILEDTSSRRCLTFNWRLVRFLSPDYDQEEIRICVE